MNTRRSRTPTPVYCAEEDAGTFQLDLTHNTYLLTLCLQYMTARVFSPVGEVEVRRITR